MKIKVGSYISRPSFRFNYDIDYDTPYHYSKDIYALVSDAYAIYMNEILKINI